MDGQSRPCGRQHETMQEKVKVKTEIGSGKPVFVLENILRWADGWAEQALWEAT